MYRTVLSIQESNKPLTQSAYGLTMLTCGLVKNCPQHIFTCSLSL